MKSPNILSTYGLFCPLHPTTPMRILGVERWVPARPLPDGEIGTRLRAAWLVLTGRADALVWEEGDKIPVPPEVAP